MDKEICNDWKCPNCENIVSGDLEYCPKCDWPYIEGNLDYDYGKDCSD